MNVSFKGIGEMAVTFKTTGTVKIGDPVKLSANGTVTACSEDDRFCGIVLFTSGDGFATVQLKGYTVAEYSGSAPSVGFGYLLADGDGGVAVDADKTGDEYLIIEVDTTAGTVGFYM